MASVSKIDLSLGEYRYCSNSCTAILKRYCTFLDDIIKLNKRRSVGRGVRGRGAPGQKNSESVKPGGLAQQKKGRGRGQGRGGLKRGGGPGGAQQGGIRQNAQRGGGGGGETRQKARRGVRGQGGFETGGRGQGRAQRGGRGQGGTERGGGGQGGTERGGGGQGGTQQGGTLLKARRLRDKAKKLLRAKKQQQAGQQQEMVKSTGVKQRLGIRGRGRGLVTGSAAASRPGSKLKALR